MKTNVHIFSGLLLTGVLLLSLLYFSPARAEKSENYVADSGLDVKPVAQDISGTSEPEKTIPVITASILDDPFFWVNYLRSTVRPEENDETESTGVLEEMESDPQYWVNSLKHIVAAE
jgi:hypothetical protein